MILYLGLDPGLHGGLAAVDQSGALRHTQRMAFPGGETRKPEHADDLILGWLDEVGARGEIAGAAIEAIWRMPIGTAGLPSTPQRAAKLADSAGAMRMALKARGIPTEAYLPQVWQPAIGVPLKAPGRRKALLRERARTLFNDPTIHEDVADAVLLAWLCRRVAAAREAR